MYVPLPSTENTRLLGYFKCPFSIEIKHVLQKNSLILCLYWICWPLQYDLFDLAMPETKERFTLLFLWSKCTYVPPPLHWKHSSIRLFQLPLFYQNQTCIANNSLILCLYWICWPLQYDLFDLAMPETKERFTLLFLWSKCTYVPLPSAENTRLLDYFNCPFSIKIKHV